jgi:hypothetical protein
MREREQFPPALCRAARGLLGWSIDQLAGEAGLEAEALELFEGQDGELAESEMAHIGHAFNRAGVIVIPERMAGPGVRFAWPIASTRAAPSERIAQRQLGAGAKAPPSPSVAPRNAAILPIPAGTDWPFDVSNGGGRPTRFWTYRDATGAELFHVARFDNPDGSVRAFVPRTLWSDPEFGRFGRSWVWRPLPPPRPIYNLDGLAAQPAAPVLVAACEEAAELEAGNWPRFVVVTWQGGRKALPLADWSPLAGRRVVISASLDDYHRRHASRELARLLRAAGAELIDDDLDGSERAS